MRCGVLSNCFYDLAVQLQQQLQDTECGWLCRDGRPTHSVLSGVNEIKEKLHCSGRTNQLDVCRLDSSTPAGTPLCRVHGRNMPDLCLGVDCGSGVLWLALECKCRVRLPAVDRLLGDLNNKQLGNYNAVLILLPKTLEVDKLSLEQRLAKGMGKVVVVTYCPFAHDPP
jgi:hypothetical protein